MTIDDLYQRIGFTVILLFIATVGAIIIIFPIRLLEWVIGDYIIVVLGLLLIGLAQLIYNQRYNL